MHEDYFPHKVADQRKWFVTVKGNIVTTGPLLGMDPLDATAMKNRCDDPINAIDDAVAAEVEAKNKNKAKDEVIKEVMDEFRPIIQTLKNNGSYTESLGKTIGVVGTVIEIEYATIKTDVEARLAPHGAEILFTLKHCEGGMIYCKRGKEESFTFLAHVTHPHFVDTRPNKDEATSELRQYYVFLVMNDQEVGLASDIASINI